MPESAGRSCALEPSVLRSFVPRLSRNGNRHRNAFPPPAGSSIVFRIPIRDDAEVVLLEEHHAHELHALTDANHARLREWLPWLDGALSPDDSRAFIRASLERFARGNGFDAGIRWRGRLVGTVGFHEVNRRDLATSLGYWIGAEAEGRGLVTDAARALLDVAFREWGLHRVEVRCAEGNARSRAVPERLGFAREGVIRDGERLYGRFVSLVVYGLLSHEWEGGKVRDAG